MSISVIVKHQQYPYRSPPQVNTEQQTRPSNPVVRWARLLGAAGLIGGLLTGLSKGSGFAFAIGMALPVGLFAALAGAMVGLLVKAASK